MCFRRAYARIDDLVTQTMTVRLNSPCADSVELLNGELKIVAQSAVLCSAENTDTGIAGLCCAVFHWMLQAEVGLQARELSLTNIPLSDKLRSCIRVMDVTMLDGPKPVDMGSVIESLEGMAL